jgi:hypothetical protein
MLTFQTTIAPSVTSIAIASPGRGALRFVPDRGGNTGFVTLRIYGRQFPPGTRVKLSGSGPDIWARDTAIEDFAIAATLDLSGALPGPRSVVISDANGLETSRASAVFTIESGGVAEVWVDLIGRTIVRGGREQTYYLNYGNARTVDAPVTRVWVRFPSFITFVSAPDYEPAATGTVGTDTYIAFDTPPIPAGGNGMIPFMLKPPDTPDFRHRFFELSTWAELLGADAQ